MHFPFPQHHARTSKCSVAYSNSHGMYGVRRQSVTLMCASFAKRRTLFKHLRRDFLL